MPLVVDHVSYLVENKAIIEDVSFVLDGLGLTVLLGPNDAGKSRLLKLCHGLPPLSSGSIRWGNVDPRTARQKQAMVFQRPVLLRRPAAENVDHFLKLRGVPSAERTRVIEESLEWAGLTAVADTPARKLSGGEQQSLTIARARAMNPEVLLLDEPTANLDPAATRRVEDLIRSFAADARKVIMRRIISRRLNASPTRCCPSIEAISSSMQRQRSSYMGHHTRWRCDSLQVS